MPSKNGPRQDDRQRSTRVIGAQAAVVPKIASRTKGPTIASHKAAVINTVQAIPLEPVVEVSKPVEPVVSTSVSVTEPVETPSKQIVTDSKSKTPRHGSTKNTDKTAKAAVKTADKAPTKTAAKSKKKAK